MVKRTQLILLFVLVFSAAFLLGSTQKGKADQPLKLTLTEYADEIRIVRDGDEVIEAYWKDAEGNWIPMFQATRVWITNGWPNLVAVNGDGDKEPTNGREINVTTEAVGTGSGFTLLGIYFGFMGCY